MRRPRPLGALEVASPSASPNLAPIVGANVRHLRTTLGLSLERLARASGVSRAMLCQVELGRSAPTVNVAWKIARALGVPLSALITDPEASRLTVIRAPIARMRTSGFTPHESSFVSRALFPFDQARNIEFYELRLAPASKENVGPRPPGTTANLVVVVGTLGLAIGSDRVRLGPGDAVLFDADVPHEYRNDGNEPLLMYLVMTYAVFGWERGRRGPP